MGEAVPLGGGFLGGNICIGLSQCGPQNRDLFITTPVLTLVLEMVGLDGLADGLKVVGARCHVRIPQLRPETFFRAAAATDQANRARPHIRTCRTLLGKGLYRDVPVAIGPAFLIEIDTKKDQPTHQQVIAHLDKDCPHIGIRQI